MKNAVGSTETRLPIIKKNNKWYSTLSKKYVTETYAKRINAFAKKHPFKTLIEARGHYKYRTVDKKIVGIGDQSKEIKELYYSKGTQVIETKVVGTGKKVLFAPLTRKTVKKETKKRLKELDFITSEGVSVELYKMNRNKTKIYHILRYDIDKTFNSPHDLKKWYKDAWHIINTLIATTKSVVRNRPIGHMRMYVRVGMLVMSTYDTFPVGVSIGFVLPNQSGYKIVKEDFQEKILNWIENTLTKDAYKWILLTNIRFNVYTFKGYASDSDVRVAKLRMGVLKGFGE